MRTRMMCFRRGIPAIGLLLVVAAAVVIVVTAALTTWWVLLAVIPLVMMVGCMAMMAAMARWMPSGPRAAQWGCCAESAPFTTAGPKVGSERVHH